MAWLILLAASVVEILMGLALKYANGWTRFWPSVGGVAAALASVFLLTLAMKHLPAGTAYVVWTGIGSLGITLLGIVLFGDPVSAPRIACMVMIVASAAALKCIDG
ncbi:MULTISPECIES: multidrug efflux SMR transporter [Paraburkholderia]|uniref:Guanidinium exporter n=1 Tax=Paraburkholderia largidicola TaxID=3014751 RepID=A0A7I8BQC3_9BURK|nr:MULTISPECIES: multidrug efflux SMR transporter [Paraburkholderia]BCF90842.1 quaternary ammonium compound-resistance protein SugE [Paraburkholderia sp. PGU16]BEU24631.1 multidrug efflux SMR transporter [Paraburkholderia sp. 22B1P]GJH01524.1 multidrug efflux SMR transporter [Paraburkholderia terrae]GJH32800.1 multidrug efflux SMR transporter [Paraburkholderia hospita]